MNTPLMQWVKMARTSKENVVIVTALVGVVTLAAALLGRLYQQRKKHIPPFVKDNFQAFLKNYVEGKHHWFQLKHSRDSGLVFRLSIPQLIPTVTLIVCDASLARIVLEGDNTQEELEKSFAYRGMRGVTLGVPTMVTKQTHGEGWDWARKAVSSSFSNTNLYKLLPALQIQLNQFRCIVDAHIDQNKTFEDLASWMVRLTMDFLAQSMFHVDFGTLHFHSVQNGTSTATEASTVSDGHRLILQLGVAVKEYAMMQAMIPFRKYMFWHKEVSDGLKAAKEVQCIGQKILDNYRADHSQLDLEEDKSIIAHLLRRCFSICDR